MPPADVRKTLQEGFHLTAASKACSETINTAEVYRAVEGHLGSLSSSPVVHLPRHLLPEAQSVTQGMTVMCSIFCDAIMCHTCSCPKISIWCRLLEIAYEPGVCLQIPNVEPVKLVISGPSGVGKDAIVKALQTARPDLHFVITATSR